MNELSALRRIALSSAGACARLARAGTDIGIIAALKNKDALRAAIAGACRIPARDVARLTAPLITGDGLTPEPNNADVEHVRFMSNYG